MTEVAHLQAPIKTGTAGERVGESRACGAQPHEAVPL